MKNRFSGVKGETFVIFRSSVRFGFRGSLPEREVFSDNRQGALLAIRRRGSEFIKFFGGIISMSKKLIALLLLVALVVGCALTGCKKDDNNPTGTTGPVKVVREIKKGTKVILGNTTELSGDFRWPGFGGSSARPTRISTN